MLNLWEAIILFIFILVATAVVFWLGLNFGIAIVNQHGLRGGCEMLRFSIIDCAILG